MKIKPPTPFTFRGGNRAVLLLHGFTGHSADVRMLGRFLENNGYTAHAPIYRGHGVPPEELLKYSPEDWWEDVLAAYNHLKELGFEEIAVAGLSLGGVFSLKIGYSLPVKGIIPMCAPVHLHSDEIMYQGLLHYVREYKQMEGKSKEQIEVETKVFEQANPKALLKKNNELIKEVSDNIDMIYAPLFVVQGKNDEMVDPESAHIIFEKAESVKKQIKIYQNSGHVITIGPEKEMLHQDILAFLNSLDWKE